MVLMAYPAVFGGNGEIGWIGNHALVCCLFIFGGTISAMALGTGNVFMSRADFLNPRMAGQAFLTPYRFCRNCLAKDLLH